jgi:ribosomal-protein-alanine N-acetyltransferase
LSIETKLLQHQTLTTARLTLRPVHLNDAAMFLRVGSDPENNRFTIRYADKEAVLEALAISIGSASL